MSGRQGLGAFFGKLFGRRAANTPATEWLSRRNEASPEELIQAHFAAIAAHDLDWILATLTPERARLYSDVRTIDRRRQTVMAATVTVIQSATESLPLSNVSARYKEINPLRVEYSLNLVEPELRRDPTLAEGDQWAYYLLVREGLGKPWLIADWGR